MIDTMKLVLATIPSLSRGRARLEAEIVVLRHQLNILRRSAPRRLQLSNVDRVLPVWLHRLCPSVKLVSLTGRRSFGFHQGQRSAYRSDKAGYMTASSTATSNKFSPCNTGGVHT